MLTEGEQRPTEPKEPAGGKPEAPGETGGERLGKDIRVRGESERGDSGHIGRVEEVGGKTVPQELGGVPRPLETELPDAERARYQPLETADAYREAASSVNNQGHFLSQRAIQLVNFPCVVAFLAVWPSKMNRRGSRQPRTAALRLRSARRLPFRLHGLAF
jgi:hypothetical protein